LCGNYNASTMLSTYAQDEFFKSTLMTLTSWAPIEATFAPPLATKPKNSKYKVIFKGRLTKSADKSSVFWPIGGNDRLIPAELNICGGELLPEKTIQPANNEKIITITPTAISMYPKTFSDILTTTPLHYIH